MPEPSRSETTRRGFPARRCTRRAGPTARGSAAGLLRLRRLLGLVWFVGLVQLVGLVGLLVGLRRLRMTLLEVRDDLAQVLLRQQPLALHLLEDLAPALVRLHGHDLIEGQRLRPAGGLALPLEERPRDLLVARRELAHLRPRARLHQRQREDRSEQRDPERQHGLFHVVPPLPSGRTIPAAGSCGVITVQTSCQSTNRPWRRGLRG